MFIMCKLMHAENKKKTEIQRLCDATELNSDAMIKLGDVYYQIEPILSIFTARQHSLLCRALY